MKTHIPNTDWFGHGVLPFKNKSDVLDPYFFHLAIENHYAPHHWTEKLADPILSLSIPLYYGCPNYSDYIPAESVIPIDINNPEEAIDTIKQTIHSPTLYNERFEALLEARNIILNQENIFNEFILNSIRINTGINIAKIEQDFNRKTQKKILETVKDWGEHLIIEDNAIKLSRKGMPIADEITIDLANSFTEDL